MSLTPRDTTLTGAAQPGASPAEVPPGNGPELRTSGEGTRRRIWGVCFAVFAFEIGIFLAVFPWMDTWKLNHLPTLLPSLIDIWDEPYLRGGVTGVGIVNLWISARQVLSLLVVKKKS